MKKKNKKEGGGGGVLGGNWLCPHYFVYLDNNLCIIKYYLNISLVTSVTTFYIRYLLN